MISLEHFLVTEKMFEISFILNIQHHNPSINNVSYIYIYIFISVYIYTYISIYSTMLSVNKNALSTKILYRWRCAKEDMLRVTTRMRSSTNTDERMRTSSISQHLTSNI